MIGQCGGGDAKTACFAEEAVLLTSLFLIPRLLLRFSGICYAFDLSSAREQQKATAKATCCTQNNVRTPVTPVEDFVGGVLADCSPRFVHRFTRPAAGLGVCCLSDTRRAGGIRQYTIGTRGGEAVYPYIKATRAIKVGKHTQPDPTRPDPTRPLDFMTT